MNINQNNRVFKKIEHPSKSSIFDRNNSNMIYNSNLTERDKRVISENRSSLRNNILSQTSQSILNNSNIVINEINDNNSSTSRLFNLYRTNAEKNTDIKISMMI